MAGDAGAGRADGKGRRGRGFRRAGALVEPQTRAAAARRGFAEARLKALWRDIVGEEIAAIARPLKLAAARGPASSAPSRSTTIDIEPKATPVNASMLNGLVSFSRSMLKPTDPHRHAGPRT